MPFAALPSASAAPTLRRRSTVSFVVLNLIIDLHHAVFDASTRYN